MVKEEIHLKQVEGMQSWAMNLRRDKFKDVRVRQALNFAFDFEWSNTNLFYGQYKRSRSYFNNSEMEAKGLPSTGGTGHSRAAEGPVAAGGVHRRICQSA